MQKVIKIEGMMCPHCEARVKNTLASLSGVTSAVASHATGYAEIEYDKNLTDEEIKSAIEAQGYKVISIE